MISFSVLSRSRLKGVTVACRYLEFGLGANTDLSPTLINEEGKKSTTSKRICSSGRLTILFCSTTTMGLDDQNDTTDIPMRNAACAEAGCKVPAVYMPFPGWGRRRTPCQPNSLLAVHRPIAMSAWSRHQERTYLITVMFDLQDLFYLYFCLNFLKFLLLFFYFCFYLINMKSYNHSNKSVNFINIFTAINC